MEKKANYLAVVFLAALVAVLVYFALKALFPDSGWNVVIAVVAFAVACWALYKWVSKSEQTDVLDPTSDPEPMPEPDPEPTPEPDPEPTPPVEHE